MKRILAALTIFACCAGSAVVGLAAPGDPFGGDDAGCTPDTKDHLTCAKTLSSAFARVVLTITSCHREEADYCFLLTEFNYTGCRAGALSKFNAKLASISPKCSQAQIDAATAYRDTLLADQTNPDSLDALAGPVYCDTTTGLPLNGMAGYTAPNVHVLTLQDAVGRNRRALITQLLNCHVKMAAASFAGKTFDEEACEDNDPIKLKSALQKYNKTADRLTKNGAASACLDNASQRQIGVDTVARYDALSSILYPCP
jgi:hypothetical protein